MKSHIKEIPSDTTIEHIETTEDGIRVHLVLYTEEKLVLDFQNVYAHIAINWDKKEAVEGVLLTENSEFLNSIMEKLEDLEIPDLDKIRSYQFISTDGVLLEVVARRMLIGGKTYEN